MGTHAPMSLVLISRSKSRWKPDGTPSLWSTKGSATPETTASAFVSTSARRQVNIVARSTGEGGRRVRSLGRIGVYIEKGGVGKLEIGRWSCHWAVGAMIAGIGGLQKMEGTAKRDQGDGNRLLFIVRVGAVLLLLLLLLLRWS